MATVTYFDKVSDAIGQDLRGFSDVYVLGYSNKNDGGGGHYKRYKTQSPYLSFVTNTNQTFWGLVPDGGVVNPLQSGKITDKEKIQECINFIKWWNETTTENTDTTPNPNLAIGKDSNRSAIKLIIPANRVFVVDTTAAGATGLQLNGPITIEGEDKLTSQIKLVENTVESAQTNEPFGPGGGQAHLFDAQGPATGQPPLSGITLRNFTLSGSYLGSTSPDPLPPKDQLHGTASLFRFKNVADIRFEDLVFTRSRAVIVGGDGVRGLTMRGCLMSESQRGGMVISGAADITVKDNDFRWIPDDPVAISASGPASVGTWFYKYGGSIRIVGNRCFGCRGLNVVGAKNVLIEGNICVLGRGRAIHVGTVSDQDKGDTTMLNVAIRNNIILDMMDAEVDPRFDGGSGGHRAIDLELLDGVAGAGTPTPPNVMPGLPDGGQNVTDPTRYYYTVGQGPNPVTPPPMPTPHAANILVEGNTIARTRPPASPATVGDSPVADPYHIYGFDSFDNYSVGRYGGDEIGYTGVKVPFGFLTPTEGIAVSGAARGLTIRGNQVGGCDTCISFKGADNQTGPAFSLFDVVIELNDLSDWTTAGIRFFNYKSLPQRVSILGNRGNGDPFHRNQRGCVRKNGGQWADTSADIPAAGSCPAIPAGTGAFIDARNLGFALIAANHARNVSQLVAGFSDALHTMQDNIGYCDPVAVGYNAGNRGIGNLIRPQQGWRYVIEGSDPTVPADCGRVLNTSPLATATVPTTGKWVEGTFVKCLTPPAPTPVGSVSYEVTGWRRITTGSLHTLGTHWQQQSVRVG